MAAFDNICLSIGFGTYREAFFCILGEKSLQKSGTTRQDGLTNVFTTITMSHECPKSVPSWDIDKADGRRGPRLLYGVSRVIYLQFALAMEKMGI